MSDVVRAYLGMKDKLVGIKINPSQDGEHPKEPAWFCQLVKEAALKGSEYVINLKDLACPNADITLGFRRPRYMEIEPRIKEEVERVRIGPVEGSNLVLLCLNSEQVMTLSILLGGITASFKGEMGVCGEATAAAYEQKKPKLTFLCNGARLMGGFKTNEILVAIPVQEFEALNQRIENLLKTGGSLCGCQVSDIPKEMVAAFSEAGFEKGADYFFGKVDSHQVRIYLNKDETGRMRQLTFYLPVKGTEEIKVNPPFQSKRRGNWTDIYAVFDIEALGVNLYTGKNMEQVFKTLAKKATGGR
ncbi:MAG: DUF169 domain-containing protein [bacterium]